MASLNDLWVAYLKEEGYEGGGYNTLTVNALRDATGTTKDSVNTLWYLYLTGLGYSGTINDMQYKWLGDNGYTGALNDRWKAALEDGFAFFGFDPLSLFSEGQQGAWYDPSDLPTLFQDSAGTTPVTADGDPVGLMLDKSGNDNHASQSTTASKPTLTADGLLGDGDDDFMSTEMDYQGPGFVSFVAKIEATKPGTRALISGTVGSTTMVYAFSNTFYQNSGSGLTVGPQEDFNWHIFTVWSIDGECHFRVDGVDYGWYSDDIYFADVIQLFILRNRTGTTPATISEVIAAFDTYDLATVERTEKYLADKHGVPLS